MNPMTKHLVRLTLVAILAALAAGPALANWTASGTFNYEDREWDNTGFTDVISQHPVRYADIEIVDPYKSGAKAILAYGKTDANGAFSLNVSDSSTRTVYVRVITDTSHTSGLYARITTHGGLLYALRSAYYASHNPNTNINFGVLVAAVGNGGEPFHMLDLLIYGADYIKAQTGSRPGSKAYVTLRWAIDGGVTAAAYTSGNVITMRDYCGYDDAVVMHEWGHYAMNNYSRSTNPAGIHYLSDCNEDIRLAFDEGRASTLGCSVRRFANMPYSNVYLRTTGASGPGHIENWFDLENETQYACDGDTSEVAVSRSLWDIGDGPSTLDMTPGEDETHDLLALPELDLWQVYAGPIKSATWVTLESFWNGWFDSTVNNGYLTEMRAIFNELSMEFQPDAFEPNDTAADARWIYPNDAPIHLTFFSDPQGDGKGAADIDVFKFDATAGVTYAIETLNLLSDANTYLDILDTNGSTVLASNDNRATGDESSLITWQAPSTATYYVRSKHASDWGIHGSYDLSVTTP